VQKAKKKRRAIVSWSWHNFLGPLSVALWLFGTLCAFIGRPRLAGYSILAGTAVTFAFIVGLWLTMERPPLRTMGETRLWYSFFLSGAGLLGWRRFGYSWLLGFSAVLSSAFAMINVLKPEIHSRALMPALQSLYFVPHVILYMLSYAILAAASLAACLQLRRIWRKSGPDRALYAFLDQTAYLGTGLLMLGLITGAAWAKEAWGHYWSWDPKETWAYLTLAAFLVYIHLRLGLFSSSSPKKQAVALAALPLGFLFLMVTWLGVSYLPAAQGSVHIYQ
jgi:ABC-type transport system involved in cytochrome c biogenesis permease subunit